jgi:hypothetical protein
MALSALSIAVTMLVMNFHFGNSTTPAPHWLLRGCRQLSKVKPSLYKVKVKVKLPL